MRDRGSIPYARQHRIPVKYKDQGTHCRFQLDLIVAQLLPAHEAQLLTYLRLSGLPFGLLLNFNEVRLKRGIRRRL